MDTTQIYCDLILFFKFIVFYIEFNLVCIHSIYYLIFIFINCKYKTNIFKIKKEVKGPIGELEM